MVDSLITYIYSMSYKSPEYFQINSADNSKNYRHKNHYPFNLT